MEDNDRGIKVVDFALPASGSLTHSVCTCVYGGGGGVCCGRIVLRCSAVMYACGANATVTFNHCIGQADIDNDGVCLQIESGSARGTNTNTCQCQRTRRLLLIATGKLRNAS
jgi:hypothetical protein